MFASFCHSEDESRKDQHHTRAQKRWPAELPNVTLEALGYHFEMPSLLEMKSSSFSRRNTKLAMS